MADDTSRAEKISALSSTKPEFSNVEFLDASLADPMNVLRVKLKELSNLPDNIMARRVLIITDLIGEDGRSIDILWSEGDDESAHTVQDALISMLSRVQLMITSAGD